MVPKFNPVVAQQGIMSSAGDGACKYPTDLPESAPQYHPLRILKLVAGRAASSAHDSVVSQFSGGIVIMLINQK